MMKAENTKESRKELAESGYGYALNNRNIKELFVIDLHNVSIGTEKQIDDAKSLMMQRINTVNEQAGLMISNGKMTDEQYLAGMERLIKELESYEDAKFIIEHVR